MKRLLIPLSVLILPILACGRFPGTTPTNPITPAPTISSSKLWYLTRGEAKSEQAWGVAVDSTGNIYTSGYYQSPASALFFDMVINKFSPDGEEIWRTQWGKSLGEKAFVVWVQDPFVYIGGTQHTSTALDEADMAVLTLDMKSGEVKWTNTWGQGFGYEEVDGLMADSDFLYVSGWATIERTGGDIAILKLNRFDGELVWAKTWGTDRFDSADGQMVVDDKFIFVSGRIDAESALFGGKALIAKFDKANGNYIDHRAWGGSIFNDFPGMTSNGDALYVVGLTLVYGNGGQIFLLKYDRNFNFLWQQLWGGLGGESARAAAVDVAGNILVAGNSDSYGKGKGDIALLSFSLSGRLNWYLLWGGAFKDTVQGLVISGSFVYLVGSTENSTAGLNDALLIKANANTGKFQSP